jgi:hypothetical protein
MILLFSLCFLSFITFVKSVDCFETVVASLPSRSRFLPKISVESLFPLTIDVCYNCQTSPTIYIIGKDSFSSFDLKKRTSIVFNDTSGVLQINVEPKKAIVSSSVSSISDLNWFSFNWFTFISTTIVGLSLPKRCESIETSERFCGTKDDTDQLLDEAKIIIRTTNMNQLNLENVFIQQYYDFDNGQEIDLSTTTTTTTTTTTMKTIETTMMTNEITNTKQSIIDSTSTTLTTTLSTPTPTTTTTEISSQSQSTIVNEFGVDAPLCSSSSSSLIPQINHFETSSGIGTFFLLKYNSISPLHTFFRQSKSKNNCFDLS